MSDILQIKYLNGINNKEKNMAKKKPKPPSKGGLKELDKVIETGWTRKDLTPTFLERIGEAIEKKLKSLNTWEDKKKDKMEKNKKKKKPKPK